MKTALLIAIMTVAVGCGPNLVYGCNNTAFKSFESVLPLDCDLVNRDIELAITLLTTDYDPLAYPWVNADHGNPLLNEHFSRTALLSDWELRKLVSKIEVLAVETPVFSCAGKPAAGCYNAVTNNITMNNTTKSIAHEIMHAWEQRNLDGSAGAIRLGDHYKWEEKKYAAVTNWYGWYDFWTTTFNTNEGAAILIDTEVAAAQAPITALD